MGTRTIYSCDICEKDKNYEELNAIQVKPNNNSRPSKVYDVCDDCMEKKFKELIPHNEENLEN